MVAAAYCGTETTFSSARPRLELLDGHGVQPDAGPEQEGLVIAQAHVHAAHGGIRQDLGILGQGIGAEGPFEEAQAELGGEDVHGAGGEHAQGGIGADEAVGDLADGAVAADGEDRVELFGGGLAGDAGGVRAAEGLGQLDAPAGGLQGGDDAGDEGLDGEAAGGGVVEEECATHGREIITICPCASWRQDRRCSAEPRSPEGPGDTKVSKGRASAEGRGPFSPGLSEQREGPSGGDGTQCQRGLCSPEVRDCPAARDLRPRFARNDKAI